MGAYEEKRNGGSGLRRRTDKGVRFYEKMAMVLLAAALGTGGGYTIIRTNVGARADAYTGQQAEQRKMFVDKEISRLRRRVDDLVSSIHKMDVDIAKLPPSTWRDRIRSVENGIKITHTRLSGLRVEIDRLLLKIDKLKD